MRQILLISTLFILIQTAFAEEATEAKEGPCRKLMDACKAADFAKGEQSMKKSLYKDCMLPLLADPTSKVAGVNIDFSIIAACKKIKESKLKTK
jgi:hypothetical protein